MKHMKTIAVISAACLVFTGMTAALPASADFAAAADAVETKTAKSVSFDEATGTLTLSGNVDRDEVMDYRQNEAVKKVICAKGTVLPPVCAYMFNDCCAETIDLTNADTSNVENMNYMFSGASAKTIDLSRFNTSKVTDMYGLFYACQEITELDLSSFDTSKVKDMTFLFASCPKLASLNISSFDTSNVTVMSSMFAYCKGLTSLDLSSFSTSKVREMGGMFMCCSGLTALDLSKFDTSAATDMGMMFYGCSGLKTVYASERWQFSVPLPHSRNIYAGCSTLVGGNGTKASDLGNSLEYVRIDKKDAPGILTYKEAPAPLKGDFDGSGSVSIEDAQHVLSSYTRDVAGLESTLTAQQKTAADVDGNGSVSVEDAQYILRYYTEKNVAGKMIRWTDIVKS